MMTQPLRASILSAPLGAIDRRALSQAWYSALGYARDHDPIRQAKTRRSPRSACRTSSNAALHLVQRGHADTSIRQQTGSSRNARIVATAPASAAADPARLARAIVRALTAPARLPKCASVRFDGDGGRVVLLLRDTLNGLRLIAICAPSKRLVVQRALERASRALATRGIGMVAETWN